MGRRSCEAGDGDRERRGEVGWDVGWECVWVCVVVCDGSACGCVVVCVGVRVWSLLPAVCALLFGGRLPVSIHARGPP